MGAFFAFEPARHGGNYLAAMASRKVQSNQAKMACLVGHDRHPCGRYGAFKLPRMLSGVAATAYASLAFRNESAHIHGGMLALTVRTRRPREGGHRVQTSGRRSLQGAAPSHVIPKKRLDGAAQLRVAVRYNLRVQLPVSAKSGRSNTALIDLRRKRR